MRTMVFTVARPSSMTISIRIFESEINISAGTVLPLAVTSIFAEYGFFGYGMSAVAKLGTSKQAAVVMINLYTPPSKIARLLRETKKPRKSGHDRPIIYMDSRF